MSERDDRPVQVDIEMELIKKKLREAQGKGYPLVDFWMGMDEIEKLLKVIEEKEKPKGDDWETAYMTGFEYGYQLAIVDVIKKLRGMKWYGGDKPEKRADGVPEHHAGRAADMQRKL